MRSIINSKHGKSNKSLFVSKPYKALTKIIIVTYVLFVLVYMSRENLYNLDNQYINLFAGTVPNLILSFLFTLIGMIYVVPFFKGIDSINQPIFIWIVNALNMIIFILVEWLHVTLNIGAWNNDDIIASLIGIIVSTFIYFNWRQGLVKSCYN